MFIKKRGGIKFTRLGRCTVKTNSSVTGSKVSQGFPAKDVSGYAAGFGGGWCGFLGEVIRKVIREVVRVKR